MTPAERLTEIRVQLSSVYAHLDALASDLEEPEQAASITLRADIGAALRRAKGLAIFVGQVKAP